jgi:hypothetical protein
MEKTQVIKSFFSLHALPMHRDFVFADPSPAHLKSSCEECRARVMHNKLPRAPWTMMLRQQMMHEVLSASSRGNPSQLGKSWLAK